MSFSLMFCDYIQAFFHYYAEILKNVATLNRHRSFPRGYRTR
ncbi:MAG: hypothetical protein ACI9W7_001016 [Porticoccaceae bacterium]